MSGGPLAPVIKGLAAGIGLASEYRHHRKERNAAKSEMVVSECTVRDDLSNVTVEAPELVFESLPSDSEPAGFRNTEVVESDEKQWQLDEAQDEIGSTTEQPEVKAKRDPAKMVKQFADAHLPTENFLHARLSLPVVLPQRRPKDRTRGFIRAYTPSLQSCDIDQPTFTEFIEIFNAATLASPWLDAINLASLAFVMLPTAISQAVSIAIAIAVDITKNMQSRYRHNYVLDQLNDDFFRPRGLYALVLTWKPESDAMKVGVNLNETIVDNLSKKDNILEKAKHNFRPSMGNSIGVAFSETAPLVFPVLDSLVNNQTLEAKDFKQKFKTTKGLVAEYFDRRAQAEYAGEHPNSQLSVTKPVFVSRYSDPNNATNSGDLLALVTGGKLSRPPRGGLFSQRVGMSKTDALQGRGLSRFQQYRSYSSVDQYSHDDQYSVRASQHRPREADLSLGSGNGLLAGGIKRAFQHHVLYLAIINMPTDEELAQATEYLNQAQCQAHREES